MGSLSYKTKKQLSFAHGQAMDVYSKKRSLEAWQEELRRQNLSWDEGLENLYDAKKVQFYYDFLHARPYFFSKEDRRRILSRHIYESLIFCAYVSRYLEKHFQSPVSCETSIIDAGSGAGLPGFLFFCRKPSPQVMLLDASRRRLSKLEMALKLYQNEGGESGRVHFSYERIEEHKADYDCVLVRALFPFPWLLELCCHLPKKGAVFALAASKLELSLGKTSYISRLGFVLREIIMPLELQFLGERQIWFFEKNTSAARGYPRSWKEIKALSKLKGAQ